LTGEKAIAVMSLMVSFNSCSSRPVCVSLRRSMLALYPAVANILL
jgi:hypothetical protein